MSSMAMKVFVPPAPTTSNSSCAAQEHRMRPHLLTSSHDRLCSAQQKPLNKELLYLSGGPGVEAWRYLPLLQGAPQVPAAVPPHVPLAQVVEEHPHPLSTLHLHVHGQGTCASSNMSSRDRARIERPLPASRGCLTWIQPPHVIPEVDALGLGASRAEGGEQVSSLAGREDVCSGVDHHVEPCRSIRVGGHSRVQHR